MKSSNLIWLKEIQKESWKMMRKRDKIPTMIPIKKNMKINVIKFDKILSMKMMTNNKTFRTNFPIKTQISRPINEVTPKHSKDNLETNSLMKEWNLQTVLNKLWMNSTLSHKVSLKLPKTKNPIHVNSTWQLILRANLWTHKLPK